LSHTAYAPRMRQDRSPPQDAPLSHVTTPSLQGVTQHSSPPLKIALFGSLFRHSRAPRSEPGLASVDRDDGTRVRHRLGLLGPRDGQGDWTRSRTRVWRDRPWTEARPLVAGGSLGERRSGQAHGLGRNRGLKRTVTPVGLLTSAAHAGPTRELSDNGCNAAERLGPASGWPVGHHPFVRSKGAPDSPAPAGPADP